MHRNKVKLCAKENIVALSIFEIQELVRGFVKQINAHWDAEMPVPQTLLVDTGRVAGKAHFASHSIQINPLFLKTDEKKMIEQTIPHELAHLATKILFPYAKQVHGPEFRRVLGLISDNTDTFHDMDVRAIADESQAIKTQQVFMYSCLCPGRIFKLSKVKHNRFKKGQSRYCTRCGSILKFARDSERKI